MRTYTTCPGCGELLLYLGRYNSTHAFCKDPSEYIFQLEKDFVAAVIAGEEARADELQETLDSLDKRPPRLLDAALVYAGWGWPVFPLKPGEKIPFDGSHGFKDATTDPRVIRSWWTRYPTANIGLPTGLSFDVVDVDFKHGAAWWWPDLRDSPQMPTAHGISVTPTAGLHILLLPAGLGNHANMANRPGLDYRGRGGYIVSPPSVLAGGRNYMWDVKPSPLVTTQARRVERG